MKRSYRFPNGYGTVYKLSGNRRNPWIARKTIGCKLVDGKPKQEYLTIGYFPTEPKAIAALESYNQGGFSPTKNYKFGELYDIWSEKKYPALSKSLVRGYKAAYKKFGPIINMNIRDIRVKHMQDIIDNNNWKYDMRVRAKIIMSGVFTFAMQNDFIKKDYSQYLEVGIKEETKKKTVFSKEEIDTLWDNLNTPYVDSVLMLIYTGYRCSELLSLETKNIDLQNRITIGGSKTKAGIGRVVPIAEKVLPLFEKNFNKNKKYLFLNARGYKMGYDYYIDNCWKPVMEKFGMKHTPHETRHSFATYADRSGMEKLSLKLIMGHSVNDVTDGVYIHKSNEDLIKAIDCFKIC